MNIKAIVEMYQEWPAMVEIWPEAGLHSPRGIGSSHGSLKESLGPQEGVGGTCVCYHVVATATFMHSGSGTAVAMFCLLPQALQAHFPFLGL